MHSNVDRTRRNRIARRLSGAIAATGLALLWSIPGFAQSADNAERDQPRVRTATLSDIAIQVDRSVPGTVVSLRSAMVASELAASVTRMDLVPGQLVSAGDRLITLDCGDSELSLQSARSRLAALEARRQLSAEQLGRLRKLAKNKSATEDQISQRAAELAIAEAEIVTQKIAIDTAEQQVGRCEIRAPFPGLVTETPAQPGSYLTPGSPVARLIDTERIELSANLLEPQVQELINGAPWFAFGGRDWPLRVRTVFPVIDQATQTREIRFDFAEDKPPPGAIGRLRWRLNGLTIPTELLVSRDDGVGVFVLDALDKSRVRFLAIEGARAGQPVNVGLPAELRVITDGRFGLKDGEEVIVED